jgi:hypothetical protein
LLKYHGNTLAPQVAQAGRRAGGDVCLMITVVQQHTSTSYRIETIRCAQQR